MTILRPNNVFVGDRLRFTVNTNPKERVGHSSEIHASVKRRLTVELVRHYVDAVCRD